MLQVKFQARMQARFLDREVAKTLRDPTRKFLMRAGGAVRLTARRSLKLAKQTPLEQLSEDRREQHLRHLAAFHAGRRLAPPRLPDQVSQPGQPPLLHNRQSLLKTRLFFALANDKRSVVVGPELVGKNRRAESVPNQLSSIQKLEEVRPFMEPAFDKIEPKFSTFWPKG